MGCLMVIICLLLVGSGFMLLCGVPMMLAGATDADTTAIVVVSLLVFVPCMAWVVTTTKQQMKEADESLTQALESEKRPLEPLEHMDGLPLAPGAQCSIFYNSDEDSNRLEISGGGNVFRLALDKICDIALKTDVEIQKQYVSSVGGAVGGYMLFGGLGAMIGGRAKERETAQTEYYLIITYRKNEDLAYISFKADDQRTAKRFVEIVSSKLTHEMAPAVVDL